MMKRTLASVTALVIAGCAEQPEPISLLDGTWMAEALRTATRGPRNSTEEGRGHATLRWM